MTIELKNPISFIPPKLSSYNLKLSSNGRELVYSYNRAGERTGITRLLSDLNSEGIALSDLQTQQSSLEDIFVNIVKE